MKINIVDNKSVVIITPTILSDKLEDAVNSVQNQTYKNLRHLVVVDGVNAIKTALTPTFIKENIDLTVLHQNTGKFRGNSFYGHRIYAGFSHLVNEDYVFFLDEDNTYEPNHVEMLVRCLNDNSNYNFAFSLRNICDTNLKFICQDNCEALGLWPIYLSPENNPQYLIDTSSFAFRREFLINTGHLWHSGWGGDRRYLASVRNQAQFGTSGFYTLNYRLDGNPGSVNADFFHAGNLYNTTKYNGNFPWRNPAFNNVEAL